MQDEGAAQQGNVEHQSKHLFHRQATPTQDSDTAVPQGLFDPG